VYGIVLTGMSVGFAGIAEWSLGEGRTRVLVAPDKRWAARLRFMSGGLVYLLVVGLAFISAPAALGLSGLVAVYYVFERTPALGTAAEADETGDAGDAGQAGQAGQDA
jgi:TMEM175 potassium channel family protein